MTPEYNGPEQRTKPRSPEEIEAGRKAQERTIGEVEMAFELKLREHEDREKTWLTEQINIASEALRLEVLKGFPNEDPVKHREYHQAKIDAAREEKEFWKLAKMKLVERGVGTIFDVLKIVMWLAIGGFLMKMGLGVVAAKWLG